MDHLYVAGHVGLEEVKLVLGVPYLVLVGAFREFDYKDHVTHLGESNSRSLRRYHLAISWCMIKYCDCGWLGRIAVGWVNNAATQCGIMCIKVLTNMMCDQSTHSRYQLLVSGEAMSVCIIQQQPPACLWP